MSAETLWALNNDAVWSVKQTASLLHLSPSAAYKYYGKRELPFSYLRQFVHYAPPDVASKLLTALTAGSPHRLVYIDGAMDFNGDGDVNTDDVLDHAIDAVEKMGVYLKAVRENGQPDMALLSPMVQCAIRALDMSERCAFHLADSHAKRNKLNGGGPAR